MRVLVAGVHVLIGSSLWEGLADAYTVPVDDVGCLRVAVTEDSA